MMSDNQELKYPLIRRAILQTPWAILPSKLDEIVDFMAFKAAGGSVSLDEIQARFGENRERAEQRRQGQVAVLPITGTLSHRMNLMSEASGGASYEGLTKQFRDLVNDQDVSAIVLDVDSPGGSVSGVDELAEEIYQARGSKPITAVANSLMASAAYWVASAADEIVATPSAELGSIGVMAAHEDRSGMLEKLGVDMTIVSAGKYKAENNPFEPMTDEGHAAIQKRVDEAYGRFIDSVAKHRGVLPYTVREGFGEGRVVGAQEAVSLGMADRIGTFDDVVSTITSEPAGEPSGQPKTGLSFAGEGEAALAAVWSFAGRARALAVLRAEEGRELSAANCERLLSISDSLQAADLEVQGILASSDPAREHRHAARDQRLRRNSLLRSADVVIHGVAD